MIHEAMRCVEADTVAATLKIALTAFILIKNSRNWDHMIGGGEPILFKYSAKTVRVKNDL
ncbi:hypothetical protein EL17_13220 [Anditalea andensis]|uniref:Uncharacterized protein n=1 Tax=Anditalea andensis TaxID=1048983 RepID=A0A074KWI7_9BACT|nr:hypothetical protein EL17_13220 [Anditalea andensis]